MGIEDFLENGDKTKADKIRDRTTSEKSLVDAVCGLLDRESIEYTLEYSMNNTGAIADLVIHPVNIAIEFKRNDSTRNIQNAIGQCKSYELDGFSTAIIIPERPVDEIGNSSEKLVTHSGISYLEFVDNKPALLPIFTKGFAVQYLINRIGIREYNNRRKPDGRDSYREGAYSDKIDDRDIVEYIDEKEVVTTKMVAEEFDYHIQTARRRLKNISERGEIKMKDVSKRYVWYSLKLVKE